MESRKKRRHTLTLFTNYTNRVGKHILHTLALLIIVHCSLFIVNCSNPLVIQILQPKTISFETNGGSHVPSQTVYRDYPVKRPSNPVKSGCTFDAWYVDNETFLEEWDFGAIPAADMTLYAKWNDGEDIDPDPISEIAVSFDSVSADGSPTETTTELTLTFSAAIDGLGADDITLSGVAGVSKGTLSGTGPVYTLAVGGITAGGTLDVSVSKSGYSISGSPKTVTIYYYNSGTAGIILNVAQITEGAPIFAGITISRTGSNNTYIVTVSNASEYSSIAWEISGAGDIYANPPVTGSGAIFTLSAAADSRYNSTGGHFLILTVVKGGVQYQRAIPFTIEP